MAVPRGASVIDLTARMTAAYTPRRAVLATFTATGTGVPVQIDGSPWPGNRFTPGDRVVHTVTVQGTFSASVTIQGSQDNHTWFTLTPDAVPAGSVTSGAFTAPGVGVYRGAYRTLQAVCTAYTSGTATVLIDSSQP